MLELSRISKSFPGVKSLDDVSLSVSAGEIHGLVGENGAGKSTLTKIIAGVYRPDEGKIRYNGEDVRWHSPRDAKARGIHVIYQELELFPQLSVAENVLVGFERKNRLGLIDYRKARADTNDLLAKLGVSLDPRELVKNLTVANQQMVEIARAMVHDVKLLILDEPTAVIAGKEVELLFKRLRALRERGVAVIYISHRLDEIFELCDRVTVLKDGKLVGTRPVAETSRNQLVSMMVGREMSQLFPPKPQPHPPGPEVLRVENLWATNRVKDVSLDVHAGEIVGLAGMVGSGRTDVAMSIFGGTKMTAGEIVLDGKSFFRITPREAIRHGIGFVTEDRKAEGLAMNLDVAANVMATTLGEVCRRGLIDSEREREVVDEEIEKYQIACTGPNADVKTLSGGNQQKVLLSRWTRVATRVLILDEPTRGVDVGAKAEIYRVIRKLADRGLGILLISSELQEIIGLADRVVVMREGRVTGELAGDQITEERIMHFATAEKTARYA